MKFFIISPFQAHLVVATAEITWSAVACRRFRNQIFANLLKAKAVSSHRPPHHIPHNFPILCRKQVDGAGRAGL